MCVMIQPATGLPTQVNITIFHMFILQKVPVALINLALPDRSQLSFPMQEEQVRPGTNKECLRLLTPSPCPETPASPCKVPQPSDARIEALPPQHSDCRPLATAYGIP
ncbi:unnamed protein product [Cuscuta epithymum]|uniref:Uncharacterized protein n=1 Tax=Cuscuta epithymum TaxID=186058 RepID=A0AAV0D134_9ASTE|nr:unnamed protein product [Cuscuta epithymum]